MTQAPIELQDLRRKIYAKAKADKRHRFWGIYVHICKEETLRKAYEQAKANGGAPGIDGETFESVEASEAGVEGFLKQLRDELEREDYRPQPNRRKEIPKDGGKKLRVLGIPTIRDRVVQGAVKLILEPIFETDFQPGSFGYRPNRSAHHAIHRVVVSITEEKTRVIDLDLKSYFDNVRHHILMEKVARRISDRQVLRLVKLMLKANGKKGVPQGGVISPMLSNVYLTQVDEMLERAKEVTREDRFTRVEYARYADDLVILVDFHPRHDGLYHKLNERVREELTKLQVEVNEEKSRNVDLMKGESFEFLGFEFRLTKRRDGRWRPHLTPKTKARTELLRKLSKLFRSARSQPAENVIALVNPVLRGWVTYFRIGDSSRCFSYVRQWVELKMRRHLARNSKRGGFGWKRWSTPWLYRRLGLFNDYKLPFYPARLQHLPDRYVT